MAVSNISQEHEKEAVQSIKEEANRWFREEEADGWITDFGVMAKIEAEIQQERYRLGTMQIPSITLIIFEHENNEGSVRVEDEGLHT